MPLRFRAAARAARASARTTWKLLKDVPRSAVRKARRAEGALWTARPGGAQVARVTRTAVRGNSLVTLADFFVRQVTDFHLIFREQAGLRGVVAGLIDEAHVLSLDDDAAAMARDLDERLCCPRDLGPPRPVPLLLRDYRLSSSFFFPLRNAMDMLNIL